MCALGESSSATTSKPRKQRKLSRRLLIEGCLRISDAEGVEGVTLRRLGADLGVDATAVYRHFRNKRELLAATADHVLTDALRRAPSSGAWRADVSALALAMRAAYLRHPGLAAFVATSDGPLPNEARLCEVGLSLLVDAGFSDADAVSAFEVIEAYTLAVSNLDASSDDPSSAAWGRSYASLSAADYPYLARLAPLLYRDDDARFSFGLDLLLSALEARLSGAPRV